MDIRRTQLRRRSLRSENYEAVSISDMWTRPKTLRGPTANKNHFVKNAKSVLIHLPGGDAECRTAAQDME